MPHELARSSVVTNDGATVRNADVICESPMALVFGAGQCLSNS